MQKDSANLKVGGSAEDFGDSTVAVRGPQVMLTVRIDLKLLGSR